MSDSSHSSAPQLCVIGGAGHGLNFPLRPGVDEVFVGSDPGCRFQIDLPGVSPTHARFWIDAIGIEVHDVHSPRGIWVNGEPVARSARLADGDLIWLGPPGDESSVCIECQMTPRRAGAAASRPDPFADDAEIVDEAELLLDGVVAPSVAPDSLPVAPPAGDVAAVGDDFMVVPEAATRAPSVVAPRTDFFEEDSTIELPRPIVPDPWPAAVVETPPPVVEIPPPVVEPAPAAAADDAFFVDVSFPAAAAAAEPAVAAFEDAAAVGPASVPGFETLDFGPAEPVPPVSEPAASDSFSSLVEEAGAGETPASEPIGASDPIEATPFAAVLSEQLPALVELPGEPETAATQQEPLPVLFDQPIVNSANLAPSAAPVQHLEPEQTPDEAPLVLPVVEPFARPPAPAPAAAETPPAAVELPRRPVAVPVSPRPRKSEATSTTGRLVAVRAPSPPPVSRTVVLGGIAALALAAAGFFGYRFWSAPALVAAEPLRARVGQSVTLRGKNFGTKPEVLFGDLTAVIESASSSELRVEVPDLPTVAGRDTAIALRVRAGGRETATLSIDIYQTPRLHGISPSVALPGDEVVLLGSGWGRTPVVRFGTVTAELIDVSPGSLRVRVPALEGAPGTEAPTVVRSGSDESNVAPFMLGRLPLVLAIEPTPASPGDVVKLRGRGFRAQPGETLVRVAGSHALLVSGSDTELTVVVPRVAAGTSEAAVEVSVRGSEHVGSATLALAAPAESVEFRFIPEPFVDAAEHTHVLLATGVGPALVISASAGATAAERAVAVAARLVAAAAVLKASRDADFELRGLEDNPSIGLAGREEVLLEVTDADVAAYAEDWTRLGDKGGPIDKGRLARWWNAVLRDLVLLLVRGEKPRHATVLAPVEAKVLGELATAASRTGRFGVPIAVAAGQKPPALEAMRTLALRVPATVPGPSQLAGAAPAASTALRLDGVWAGSEIESGSTRYISVTFKGNAGSLGIEGALTMNVPIEQVEQPQRGTVRFRALLRGVRYYQGRWDGRKLTGRISSDTSGKGDIGTFELAPSR